jgi:hypothetical protein
MKNFFFISILVLVFYENAHSQTIRGCDAATAEDVTHWGHIADELEADTTIKKLHGIVRDSTKAPIYAALVEVFADDGKIRTPTSDSVKRLAACITRQNGKFRFDGMKPGKYILAVGRLGFNITFVRFTLEPKSRRSVSKRLTINLHVGT